MRYNNLRKLHGEYTISRQKQFCSGAVNHKKGGAMPWYNGDYPPSYKNQPKYLRDKATEIANEILKSTGNEGEAIATGLKQAREHFKAHPEEVPSTARKD